MKKSSLAFVLLLLFSGFSAAKEIIRLTNGEWPPYLSANLHQHGYASQIVKEAFAAEDIDVVFGFYPWERAFQYAKKGESWHGSLVWVYSDERAKDFYYSDSVISDQAVLFFLKDSPLSWNDFDDLKGKVIGGTRHTKYPLIEKAQKQGILAIDRAGNYDILFKRLLIKRIDAVPQVKHVGKYFLKNSLTAEELSKVTFSPTASRLFIKRNLSLYVVYFSQREFIKNSSRHQVF